MRGKRNEGEVEADRRKSHKGPVGCRRIEFDSKGRGKLLEGFT